MGNSDHGTSYTQSAVCVDAPIPRDRQIDIETRQNLSRYLGTGSSREDGSAIWGVQSRLKTAQLWTNHAFR